MSCLTLTPKSGGGLYSIDNTDSPPKKKEEWGKKSQRHGNLEKNVLYDLWHIYTDISRCYTTAMLWESEMAAVGTCACFHIFKARRKVFGTTYLREYHPLLVRMHFRFTLHGRCRSTRIQTADRVVLNCLEVLRKRVTGRNLNCRRWTILWCSGGLQCFRTENETVDFSNMISLAEDGYVVFMNQCLECG